MDPKIESRKDFYPDGALENERSVRIEADGTETNHGPFVRWHPNGLKAEEGSYENGVRVGRWRSWLDTGRNFFDGDYLDATGSPSPDEATPETSAVEEFTGPPLGSEARSGLMFEFIVVLSLIWVRPFVSALISYIEPTAGRESWYFSELGRASVQIAEILVLLFVIAKSGEGVRAFGLTKPRYVIDLFLGAMTCLFMYASHVQAMKYIGGLYAPSHSHHGRPGPLEFCAIVGGLTINSMAEELGMRAYLMRRIAQISGSFVQAIFVPAVLFASYHIYSGPGHVIVVFGHGLVLGVIYWWTRRLWPVFLAHASYNVALYAVSYDFIS